MAGDEPRLVIYGARWKDAGLAVMSPIMVAILAWAWASGATPIQPTEAILILLILGGGGLLGVWRLFRPDRLILAPAGFTIAMHGHEHVFLWRDVDEFFVSHVLGKRMACWRYRAGREPPARNDGLTAFLGRLGHPTVGSGWSQSPKRLVATLTEWRDRYGA